ncbi:MAG: putative manganese-dependent inorganic diphosphatase [Lachnospiraceae bacterium]|nr:putative manganese-dependent inorganic diphosphatase [Lachnospiraceae bacterium]
MASKRAVSVVGHMNPDTDSICSAIAYANLKQTLTGNRYQASRAGTVNPETQYVLDYFGVEAPVYLDDVRQRVKDIEIKQLDGLTENVSMKKAWEYMHEHKVVCLAVLEEGTRMIGVLSMGDITRSYMDIYDAEIVGKAHTPYQNILETVNGKMVVGDPTECVEGGKVLIAAANPDVMEQYIDEGDVVLLGNRYESQLCAIEMKAACIIISNGAQASLTIKKIANDRGCKVIESDYDTYTLARLMNQSIPVGYFMMRGPIDSFTYNDFLDDVRVTMAEKRHRYFPVLDELGRYAGMISRRNLLSAQKRQVILVDHNEKSQAVPGLADAEILEIIDHHRIGNIETTGPVYFRNQPVGCTATIVYQMYLENGVEIPKPIAGLLLSAILSDTLAFRSPTCTEVDKRVAQSLAKIAEITDIEKYASNMFAAGSDLANRSAHEIFTMDFKKFKSGDIEFAVGQISSMSEEELQGAKEKMMAEVESFREEQRCKMIFFMLTNIMKESSEVIYCGEDAARLLACGFGLGELPEDGNPGTANLPGVISRKKQMIPRLMEAFQVI